MISRLEMYAVGVTIVLLVGLYLGYVWPRSGVKMERLSDPIETTLPLNW